MPAPLAACPPSPSVSGPPSPLPAWFGWGGGPGEVGGRGGPPRPSGPPGGATPGCRSRSHHTPDAERHAVATARRDGLAAAPGWCSPWPRAGGGVAALRSAARPAAVTPQQALWDTAAHARPPPPPSFVRWHAPLAAGLWRGGGLPFAVSAAYSRAFPTPPPSPPVPRRLGCAESRGGGICGPPKSLWQWRAPRLQHWERRGRFQSGPTFLVERACGGGWYSELYPTDHFFVSFAHFWCLLASALVRVYHCAACPPPPNLPPPLPSQPARASAVYLRNSLPRCRQQPD